MEDARPCFRCGGKMILDEMDEPNAYFECKGCNIIITVFDVYSESEAIEFINKRED